MRSSRPTDIRIIVAIVGVIALTGCYEKIESTPQPQAQSDNPPTEKSAPSPYSGYSGSGGSSALGGAKRSAESVIGRAEQHSQNVADQADELAEDN